MKTGLFVFIVLLAAAVAGGGGYWYGQHSAGGAKTAAGENATTAPAEKDAPPVAAVQTTPIVQKNITASIISYGTVIAQPGEMRIISVPFEARLGHILVTPGQPVETGTPLISIEPSPDTLLQLREAQSVLAAAEINSRSTQQRFEEKLATTQDLAQARQAAESAKLKLESLQSRGIGAARELKADAIGVIGKVNVQEGQIVAAGTSLVEVIVEDRIEVRLGLEPAEVGRVKRGQLVKLHAVNSPSTQPLTGTVRLVTQTVNPDTRLVDVFTALAPHSHLMLSEYLRAELPGESKAALVVPRAAIVTGEKGTYTLFTIADGKAVEHTVTLGLQNDDEVEVSADDLQAGQSVVIVGNAELETGMAVTEKAP